MNERRIRFDCRRSAVFEGTVVELGYDDGYWVVTAIEPDPDAEWEVIDYLDQINEAHPKTMMVVLRPATEEEVSAATPTSEEVEDRTHNQTAWGRVVQTLTR